MSTVYLYEILTRMIRHSRCWIVW